MALLPKISKSIISIIVLTLSFIDANAQDRYWVGGTGSWSQTAHEIALKEEIIRHKFETNIKLIKEPEQTSEMIRNEIARDIQIGAELTKISLS